LPAVGRSGPPVPRNERRGTGRGTNPPWRRTGPNSKPADNVGPMTSPTACVISGGVGAARLLDALGTVVDPRELVAVANVGDDLNLHGLHISPDLDTITYTLAGEINPETGWGLRGETWQAMESVGRYGGIDWFNLGDRDLGTHL